MFVAEFDEGVDVKPVLPAARQQAIERCTDPLRKRQSYCVWRLLDYALKQTVGKGVEEMDFTVDGNGKWSCNGGVHFSLSHCARVVAVAVCERPVGIDVEALDTQRFDARLAERILTEKERSIYDSLPIDERALTLVKIWTKKEGLFKRDGGKSFVPNAIDTTDNEVCCQEIVVGSKEYVVAVIS